VPELPEVQGLAVFLAERAGEHRIAEVEVGSLNALRTFDPRPADLLR